MSFAALQAAWAEWLLDGLIASGVRHAVVSPGSRSTPIVLAIARAEADGRLRADVVIDERAAAFFALGRGRVTGEPSLLACTSGTAGTHYLPAVVEASESRVPLVALTADRPPERQGRGASQTIDQSGMFGRFVRRTFEVGPAEAEPRAVDGLLRTGGLAVHATRWPDPGPVHLNVAFRKPLEPDGSEDETLRRLRARAASRLDTHSIRPAAPACHPVDAALDAVADRIESAPRGLIVLGPCGPSDAPPAVAVERLARATGYPVLAEATSQHRFGAATFDPCLDVSEPLFGARAFRERAAPEFVLQVGGAPTGRALGRWIEASGVERVVLARHGVPEAYNQAAAIVLGDLGPVLEALSERVEAAADAGWVRTIDRVASRVRELADHAASRAGSQGQAVRSAVDSIPEGGQLVLGNSMPVRDVDLYVPAGRRGIGVLSQRGAAGIDGLIAGAAGAAAAAGRPTLLLLGDVSFQHDVGGLAAAAMAGRAAPLAIVVVGNGGGRLFELLPVRDLPDVSETFERFFLTPPEVDAVAAADAFGVRARRVSGGEELRDALGDALSAPGAAVLDVAVESDGVDELLRISDEVDGWWAESEVPQPG